LTDLQNNQVQDFLEKLRTAATAQKSTSATGETDSVLGQSPEEFSINSLLDVL